MNSDPHEPYVKALAEAGDWAALARYWIAHQHGPALEQAILLVRGRVLAGESHWQPLLDYLEAVKAEPFDSHHQTPETLLPHLEKAERLTLRLLHLNPLAALCESAIETPPKDQVQLVQTGIESAKQAAQAGVAVGDAAVAAFFLDVMARGLYEVRQMEGARQALGDAVGLYRDLARQRPEVYLPGVAMALNHLGNVQSHLNDLEAARASYEEALEIRRELARARLEVYRPDVAGTLSNLGNVQIDLNDREAARANCEEALAIWRNLAEQQPGVYRLELAETLNNLGNVQRDLNDLEAARANCEEALAIWRDLARQRSEVYRPDVATTLRKLCLVQLKLGDLEAARANCEEALAIQRDLARQQPEVYRPGLAATLNSLCLVQSELEDLEAARANCEEALAIRRDLAEQAPEVYRPWVAVTLNNLGKVESELNELELARASYEEALAIQRKLARQRPEVYRRDVAITLLNLGTVQRCLDDLGAARASCEEALAIRRDLARQQPEVYRLDVARTLRNLGIVQDELGELEGAKAGFEESLAICRDLARLWPGVYRPDLAMTLNDLGVFQSGLNDLEAARASYEEAARLYEENARQHPDAELVQRLRLYTNLAVLVRCEDVRLGWPDYRAARRHLDLACHCAEQFRGKFRDERERRRVQAESFRLFELHVRNCVDVWDVSVQEGRPDVGALRQAVWAAEASRSRQLLDKVAQEELRPVLAPPGLQAEYARLREQLERTRLRLRREEHGGETGLRGTDTGRRGLDFGGTAPEAAAVPALRPRGSVRKQLSKLLQHQDKQLEVVLLERIKPHDPEFDPKQAGRAIACEAIEALVPPEPRTAFVQYALGREKSVAFVPLGANKNQHVGRTGVGI